MTRRRDTKHTRRCCVCMNLHERSPRYCPLQAEYEGPVYRLDEFGYAVLP